LADSDDNTTRSTIDLYESKTRGQAHSDHSEIARLGRVTLSIGERTAQWCTVLRATTLIRRRMAERIGWLDPLDRKAHRHDALGTANAAHRKSRRQCRSRVSDHRFAEL
jgi:hypothetical protein